MKNIPIIITGVLMGLAFIGMLYCAKKQREYPNMQFIAVFLLIVIIGLGGFMLWETGVIGEGETGRLIANEMKYSEAKSLIFGRYLASKYAGAKALVIVNRDYDKNPRQAAIVDKLKEGLGSAISVRAIDWPKFPKGTPQEEMMMPIEEMLSPEIFEKIIEVNPGCDLIISTIGLPQEPNRMRLWAKPKDKRPKVALLNADVFMLKEGIERGLISAVVAYKPDVKFTENAAPSDPQVAFDERYIIIAPDNIKKLTTDFPKLFQQ